MVTQKISVMSHHCPTNGMYCSEPQYVSSAMNSAFCSDLTGILNPNVVGWCHGHTHYWHDVTVNQTRIVSNPAGYKQGCKSYDRNFVVEFVVEK